MARLLTVAAWTFQRSHLPARQTVGGKPESNMGYWLTYQRSQLSKQRLPDDRLRALDSQLAGWQPEALHHAPFEAVCFQETESEIER